MTLSVQLPVSYTHLDVYKRQIIYKLKDELVCIEADGSDIIRVRITRNSTVSDEKWTLLDVEDCSCETEITEGKASVTSGILRSEICDLPWGAYMLSFYKNCSLILRTHEEGEYLSLIHI